MTLSDACKTALRQRAWDQMLVWLRLRAIKEARDTSPLFNKLFNADSLRAHIRAALENCDE